MHRVVFSNNDVDFSRPIGDLQDKEILINNTVVILTKAYLISSIITKDLAKRRAVHFKQAPCWRDTTPSSQAVHLAKVNAINRHSPQEHTTVRAKTRVPVRVRGKNATTRALHRNVLGA
ncbi:hypothetical protein Zmor_012117 [Zophobas morio]|jgi:hypothetical protein|uniref:Uncharacterized protein n=1 Tax=Zophobas morio TaxID=2755281 RepID=A0AA38HHI5_9CUCU|nr:hypothetical protein Zmor_012117 [Zophobas morio]